MMRDFSALLVRLELPQAKAVSGRVLLFPHGTASQRNLEILGLPPNSILYPPEISARFPAELPVASCSCCQQLHHHSQE